MGKDGKRIGKGWVVWGWKVDGEREWDSSSIQLTVGWERRERQLWLTGWRNRVIHSLWKRNNAQRIKSNQMNNASVFQTSHFSQPYPHTPPPFFFNTFFTYTIFSKFWISSHVTRKRKIFINNVFFYASLLQSLFIIDKYLLILYLNIILVFQF